ncbi:gamma-glutamyl-gamma-aminobutyrate hydrolase family protein [Tissierella creatinini]|nr:gamma-glutamyl-gamma-aminobutyrate hydrolase family protein [Tissierella creatinini]TJX66150.1 gamma-glutamyl-gamma-aminobutyrate hydrolase family protein [Soehngenia saccharolytica]
MKPVIGLTCEKENLINRSINRVNYPYIMSVIAAGGIPIIIPTMEDTEDISRYLDIVDGVIFTGGGDVSTHYFNEEPIREVEEVCQDRDMTEMALFHEAYKRGKPIFGICRGIQLINIALGGSIYQDIYTQVPNVLGHTCANNIQDGYHIINIKKESILYDIFQKEKLVVNSQHHQSIKSLGKDLRVIAEAKDGIIEAIESTNENFILGLQFHPEAMAMKYEEFLKPFKYFIDRC